MKRVPSSFCVSVICWIGVFAKGSNAKDHNGSGTSQRMPSTQEISHETSVVPALWAESIVNSLSTEWDKYIAEKTKTRETTVADLDLVMKGRYRDRGIQRLGGSGARAVYYLIDDYFQLRAVFGSDDRLESPPMLQPATKWCRRPAGDIGVVLTGVNTREYNRSTALQGIPTTQEGAYENWIVTEAMERWNKYLAEKTKTAETTIADLDLVMKERYRDRGIQRLGGSGTRAMYYLIDDYFQLRAVFGSDDRLESPPMLQPVTKWCRRPDGDIVVSME